MSHGDRQADRKTNSSSSRFQTAVERRIHYACTLLPLCYRCATAVLPLRHRRTLLCRHCPTAGLAHATAVLPPCYRSASSSGAAAPFRPAPGVRLAVSLFLSPTPPPVRPNLNAGLPACQPTLPRNALLPSFLTSPKWTSRPPQCRTRRSCSRRRSPTSPCARGSTATLSRAPFPPRRGLPYSRRPKGRRVFRVRLFKG